MLHKKLITRISAAVLTSLMFVQVAAASTEVVIWTQSCILDRTKLQFVCTIADWLGRFIQWVVKLF